MDESLSYLRVKQYI